MEPAFQVWLLENGLLENGLLAHGIAAAHLPDGQRGIVATRIIQPGAYLCFKHGRRSLWQLAWTSVYVCAAYTANVQHA
jgi:hypothetical protein